MAGSALFAGYYVCFWALGIYTTPSLIAGLSMAGGLASAGGLIRHLDAERHQLVHVVVALLLSVGASLSAAFSGRTHCIGFHTLWALPLVFGLFVRQSTLGSITIGLSSLAGGLLLLIGDESNPSRIAQWVTLSVSAGVFGFVKQRLERRHIEFTVAETEQAHTRLAAADRMASVGILAAGVAHEINNPMAYVTANLEFVTKELQEGTTVEASRSSELNAALADARAGCERITSIVKTMSRLSRNEAGASAPVDVNRAIHDVLRLSRRQLDALVHLTFVAGPVEAVSGDESKLGQVFLNLVVNGVQAVEQRADGPKTLEVRTFARDPGHVVVEFSDSGCGIRPELLPRIFDPFFTTKPPGKGTGLGLALCAEIIEQHHGTLEVESTPGQGSTFRVVLPVAPPSSEQATEAAERPRPPQASSQGDLPPGTLSPS